MMCAATERVISRQEDIHRHPHQSSSGGEQVAGLPQNANHHGNAAGTGGGGGPGGEGRVRVMLSRAKRVAPPISGAAWTGQPDPMVMMPAAQEGRMPGQRVNLQDHKAKLCKILGPTREQQYWSLLTSFLNFKLSKQELDKLLPAAIGRENIVLHNQLLRAIFLNAIAAEAPSPLPGGPQSNSNSPSSYNASSLNSHDTSKPVKGVRRRPISSSSPAVSDDPSPSPGQPSPSGNVTPVWANGDAIISPRKGRSARERDRKAKDRPSPLGLLKGPDSCQPPAEQDGRRLEHGAGPGFRTGPDHARSIQQGGNAADHSLPSPRVPLAKRPKHALFVPNGLISPAGHLQDASFAHDDDAVEDDEGIIWATRSVQAPLGVPFCKASFGAPQKAPVVGVPGPLTHTLLGYNIEDECLEASELLPDTYSMMRQMQQTAVVEAGLQGVTVEAANILNHALDVYLKRMIVPAIKLAQCRRSKDQSGASCSTVRGGGIGDKEVKNSSNPLPQKQMRNGVWSSHTYNQIDATDGLSEDGVSGNGENGCPPVTPMDLMGSLETNPPALLGEDWPLLLEKAFYHNDAHVGYLSLQAPDMQSAGHLRTHAKCTMNMKLEQFGGGQPTNNANCE